LFDITSKYNIGMDDLDKQVDLHPMLRRRLNEAGIKDLHPLKGLLEGLNKDYQRFEYLVPVDKLFLPRDKTAFEGPISMVTGSLAPEVFSNYKKVIEEAGLISITDNQGRIRFANKHFCEISGYAENELAGRTHQMLKSGIHVNTFYQELWSTIQSGQVWKGIICNKSKSGGLFWIDTTIVPFIHDNEIVEYFAVSFDVTAKLNANAVIQKQKLFYESILNSIPVDIAVFDRHHHYLYVNPGAVRNEEVRQFLIGKTDFDYCKVYQKDTDLALSRSNYFNEVVKKRERLEFVEHMINREGTMEVHSRCFFPVINQNNELEYVIGFGTNVTEKFLQEDMLKRSLDEKQALLGEVHHRVKNNLALVMGLLELQSAQSNDPKVKLEFDQIQNRISAMARIHEMLYKAQEFGKIDMAGYTEELAGYLCNFYAMKDTVKLVFNLEHINLTSSKAVPLALLTNELVTNSFKYALNGGGELRFKLYKSNNRIYFEIHDSGPGLPMDSKNANQNSLGFKLIDIFVRQIKGQCTKLNDCGLHVIIDFPYE